MSVRLESASTEALTRTATVFDQNADYTWSAWFYMPTLNSGAGFLWNATTGTNANQDFALLTSGANLQVNAINGAGAQLDFADGASTQLVNTWYYITLQRTGNTLRIYRRVSGGSTALEVSISAAVTGRITGDRMNIGARGATDRANNTRVAYARLHSSVLTTAEIDAEAVSPTAVITANLWGDWPLTEATDLTDHSGNGRDWTAVGTLSTEANPPDVVEGPTIDTQPVADTGLINGDATRRTTVYTCEASTADGGGITGLDWFEDTDAIADGGIYDIVTTGIGTANASSTLTITRIVKTGTPFSMNARATDANGGTDSDAVNDTWYTGPVLSASSGTTNASGVDTLTCTSDSANADGEFTVITATAGGVTKQVALHYEVPA